MSSKTFFFSNPTTFSQFNNSIMDSKIALFLSAVSKLNDFFCFSLESNNGYASRALEILQASPSGSPEHQANVIRLVTRVESKFEKEQTALKVNAFTTEKEAVTFYANAVNRIFSCTYEDDEDFTDPDFDFSRLLRELVTLTLEEDPTDLDEFLDKACRFDARDGGGSNLSNFWCHMKY